jgi:hypothetical protein
MTKDLEMNIPAATTPEGAALTLLQIIANCEGKSFDSNGEARREKVDRAWILDTYSMCLKAASQQNY